jgi:alkanesulfonate monooxygenase SsuD/methylene tetrahydromethanopterin reductase-like flavin-dependent oxidoreductase (luciferase family)
MDFDLGVVLPTTQDFSARLIDFAVRAERLGFDSLWTSDTLLRPVIEPLTMLAAAAAVTERVAIGTAALLPAFRRPVQAAQALASLDALSGGRLIVTVGAGFPNRSEIEYSLSDVPWERRFARLDDTVALWRAVWAGERSFHGKVFDLPSLPLQTLPARPGGPPIWLGGFSPAALDRTGRLYDGWLPYPPSAPAYASGLDAVRAAAGRREVTPALFATVLVADDPAAGREALAAYVHRSYGMPIEIVETIQLLIAGPLEHIRDSLAPYAAAGARHLVIRFAAHGIDAQLEQLESLSALLDRPPRLPPRSRPGT